MLSVPLIFDRIELDRLQYIELARRMEERDILPGDPLWSSFYAEEHRGTYTPYFTMNRVGQAVFEIATIIGTFVTPPPVSPKLDFVLPDPTSDSVEHIPTIPQKENYLNDVELIRAFALMFIPVLPYVPDNMNSLTLEEANDIERILFEAAKYVIFLSSLSDSIVLRAQSPFSHAGAAMYLGETKAAFIEAPVILTTALPDGHVGIKYFALVEATNDSSYDLTWQITWGALPNYLDMQRINRREAEITGIPSISSFGTTFFTVRVTNIVGLFHERTLSISIIPLELMILVANTHFSHADAALYFGEVQAAEPLLPPTIVTTDLPNAFTGEFYSETIFATNESQHNLTWEIIVGNLPVGLRFDKIDRYSGRISGFPDIAYVGTHSFTIRVTNVAGMYYERRFFITVEAILMASSVTADSPFSHAGAAMYLGETKAAPE